MTKAKLIGSAAIGILVLLVVGTIFSIEWEKVELETGLSKEARNQPFLAANLLLEKYNASFTELNRTSGDEFFNNERITLTTNTTLIIDEGVINEIPRIGQAILQWVKRGGHLVYVLSPRREQLELSYNPLMLENLTVVDSETPVRRHGFLVPTTANVNINDNNQNFDIHLSHQFNFENCPYSAIKEAVSNITLICQASIEQGYITYMPSIDLIATNNLQRLDHGQFLLWLLGKNTYMAYLPSTISSNWFVSIINWSWQIILLFSLLIIGLTWHLAMRLGTAIEPVSETKNSFSAHLEAVGNFLVKHNHHHSLKTALMRELDTVMEKRIANFSQLSLQKQAQHLSKISGKPSQTIEMLLEQDLPTDDEQRLQFIKLFKELRNSL
ncbi:hypothetical protein [Thalassotalea sp. PLHSN55]|uniref:hypothetical protein n=1 Tax=Thalassotalea sp. PLHSN55 TaxID=3435888 RepID=UPI003F844D2A